MAAPLIDDVATPLLMSANELVIYHFLRSKLNRLSFVKAFKTLHQRAFVRRKMSNDVPPKLKQSSPSMHLMTTRRESIIMFHFYLFSRETV